MAATRHLFGDWEGAIRRLEHMHDLMQTNSDRAIRLNAMDLRDSIKETIAQSRPEWPELKPATIARKGSSKPLIDHGDLLNGIKEHEIETGAMFIGVHRNEHRPHAEEGDPPLVAIAAVMEFGTLDGRVPPRSYIASTYRDVRNRLKDRCREAVRVTLRGEAYRG